MYTCQIKERLIVHITVKDGGRIMTHEPRDKRHWNGGHVTMYGWSDVRKFLLYETSASIAYI